MRFSECVSEVSLNSKLKKLSLLEQKVRHPEK